MRNLRWSSVAPHSGHVVPRGRLSCLPVHLCTYRATRDSGTPPGINQPRKTCRKVLTSRRGAALRVQERVKPAPLSRVPEAPRGLRRDFLVLRLILPDANDSISLPAAILPAVRCWW